MQNEIGNIVAGGHGIDQRVPVGQPTSFWVAVPGRRGDGDPSLRSYQRASLKVQVIEPSGEFLPVNVKSDSDDANKFEVIYTPKNIGTHLVGLPNKHMYFMF